MEKSKVDDLVIQLLEEGRKCDAKLMEKLTELDKKIVGEDKCAEYRRISDEDCENIKERLKAIEEKVNHPIELTWNTVKKNQVLLTSFVGGVLMLIGVFSGRVYDLVQMYGLHAVFIGGVILGIGGLSAWVTRRRTKMALKKLGFWHMFVVLLLLSPVFTQEDDIVVIDTKPLTLDQPTLQQAARIIYVDLFGDECAWRFGTADGVLNNSSYGFKFISSNITRA